MMRRRTLMISSLALAAASALPGVAFAQDAAAPAIPDMVMGSADAPVTVVEYASFTCPHCQHFHETVFGELKKNYIDTGKVKFIYREVYFDKYGLWASMVARCGGEMKYFGIADILYDTQKDWIGDGQDFTIGENLKKIGLKAGISPDALDACMKDNEMAKALVANYQKNAETDGVDATPTFFIDGVKHSNMAYEEFAKLLDEKLGG